MCCNVILLFNEVLTTHFQPKTGIELANKLQSLGKTYELHVFAGDDHPLSINRLERERKIVEWFKMYMK